MMKTTTWFLSLMVGCALAPLTIPAATLYVDVNSANPTPPFTNWAIAAVTIQDAVDASVDGDTVLVNDGVYATGNRPAYDSRTPDIGRVLWRDFQGFWLS
jgi:hypothetical protein